MKEKNSISGRIFDCFNIILLSIFALAALYPFLYIVFASLSDSDQLMAFRGFLVRPLGFSLEAYKKVLQDPRILTGYKNTLIYVSTGTTLNIIMTSIAAYVVSRKKFFWKMPIMWMILLTMFFSGGLIPNYILIRRVLHIDDTLFAIILPGAINAWNLMILKTSFEGIPDSFEESAKIDGANDFTILTRIILPLSGPVLAVMVLYYGVAHWNSWFSAMIYLAKRELHPLQVILREIVIVNNTENMTNGMNSGPEKEAVTETIKYSTIMVGTLPILFAYPFLQKYFVKGVMIGGIKG